MNFLRKKTAEGLRRLLCTGALALAVFLLCGTGCAAVQSSAAQPEMHAAQETKPQAEPQADVGENSAFAVHFIDVGQADAALVLCDGASMLIDGGNAADSDLIYAYLKKLGISKLDYMVCTHAHEDHVGGLSGALNYASVGIAFAPVTEYSSKAFGNFKKYLEAQGKSITVPSAGDSFSLGSAGVKVLGPVKDTEDTNNTSIVLRIVYGETSFLFTGDAEREEEQDILNSEETLKSTVLKVGHHGSDTSTSYPFLREIMPEYAVISVGEGNSYGHPTEDTLSRLRDADVKVYRTDMQGDIICTSDGRTVSFETARNQDADTLTGAGKGSKSTAAADSSDAPKAGAENVYILNTGTGKFHYPDCSSVKDMKESNRETYRGSREDMISRGYSPCGRCNP